MKHLFKVSIFFSLITIISFLVFLAHTRYTKTAIFADGRFYYAITRSLVKDFDLKLGNEYQALNIQKGLNPKQIVTNPYPPGVSLFWVPLFIKADALVKIFNLMPFIKMDNGGYNIIYQTGVALTSILLGIFGLYLVYLSLKNYFSERISLITILVLYAATNLFFYIAVEPINSHAVSFFMSALFVYYFLLHERDKNFYLILGILGGVAGLVRTQDLLLLILPAFQILRIKKNVLKNLATYYSPSRRLSKAGGILLTTGFLLGFLPQILLWKYFYNTLWYSPYFGTGFNLIHPKIFYVLFNTQNGAFTITPIIAVAVLGFLYLRKINLYLCLLSLIYFLLQLYIVSSWNSDQGGSFGIRMMIGTYPLLAFGLASVIKKIRKRFFEFQTILLVFIFTILNSLLIINYLLKF